MQTTGDEPVVRNAVPAEAERIAAIWSSGWRDGHLGHVPEELLVARTDRSFLERAIDRIPGTRVVAVAGEVAGFAMVVDDEVEQVYLSGDQRGAGLADLLLADAEAQILAAGHQVAWLAVVAGNERARRFYQRQGWVDAGPFDYGAAGPHGPITVPCHRYERDLVDRP